MPNLLQENILMRIGPRRCRLSSCFKEMLLHRWILSCVADNLKPVSEAMLREDETVECLDPLVEHAK